MSTEFVGQPVNVGASGGSENEGRQKLSQK
jgi:hypothetical protein